MATRRTTFDKLQRERAKKAKAAAKRERRQEKGGEEGDVDLDLASEEQLSPGELLERIETVHQRYAAKQISFEEFEEQKTELLTRLSLLPIE
ncbi:MAG: hypothetical protein QOI55_2393 [Actinomycetota bacterium]|jgi:hypothetical protein|nr:hypothetical protein [Actinomycetota bacterium]